jgi:long-subunit acyl-CoA synthetase (AMP-forming)
MSTVPEATTQTAAEILAGAQTLCGAFQATAARRGDAVALRTPGDSVSISWREYAHTVRGVAAGLAAHGVGAGDTVALMLTNSPEAHIVDTAALHLGASPFSIYNTFAPEQIEYVVTNSGASVLVTEAQFAEQVLAVRSSIPALEHVFVIDGGSAEAPDLDQLLGAADPGFDFEAAWRGVAGDDVATLIYTSGTTGPPKGVELTHSNLVWTTRAWMDVTEMKCDGSLMSYLPMAHLADRVFAHYSATLTGGTITCVTDAKQAVPAIADAHPTLWLGVPRVWEKLKSSLETKIGSPPFTEEVAAQVRAQLGFPDDVFLLSGAAPIPFHVLEFFDALGLPINEGYGMTETSAVVTMNCRKTRRIGTVGLPLPGAEAKIADDGELLVRGPLIMKGYRNEPSKTAEAVDPDGWLHTGDVAQIDDDGFVKIVDRKKEIIINAAGKNMSPSNIEAKLKAASALIGIPVTIGDAKPYNTALIVLEPEATAAFAAERGIAEQSLDALAADPQVQAEVASGVQRANDQLARVEQVKKYTIVPGEWLPGGDEVTPTLKLKRKPIAEKYAAAIEAMYAG